MEKTLIAVPSMGEGGLDSERSGHFGRCDCFTLVEVVDGAVADVRIVANPPHEHGGCLRPVEILAAQGVDALVAAGMGGRPLAAFGEIGIKVYFENQTPGVGDAVLLALTVMDAQGACGGH